MFRNLLFLLMLIFLVALSFADIDFYSRGEGREALNAQGVILGNWLLPRGYGGQLASKPPLLHWIVALISIPFGAVTSMTARLPSFVTAILFGLFLLVVSPTSRRWFVSLVLFSSFEWIRAAVSCRVDMIHSATLAAALLLWPRFRTRSRNSSLILIWGTLLTTASVLSKGPVGLVLQFLVFTVWYLVEDRVKKRSLISFLADMFMWLGGAAFLSSLWYLTAILFGGVEFREIFWSENIARFAGTMADSPHEHGVFYLIGALILGFSPWSILFLTSFVRQAWPTITVPAKTVSAQENSLKRLSNSWNWVNDRFKALPIIDRYSIIVGVLVTLFYSIPSSKRGVYLLVGYPFYSILFGRILERQLAIRVKSQIDTVIKRVVLLLLSLIISLSVVGSLMSFFLSTGSPTWMPKLAYLLSDLTISLTRPLSLVSLVLTFLWLTRGGSGKDSRKPGSISDSEPEINGSMPEKVELSGVSYDKNSLMFSQVKTTLLNLKKSTNKSLIYSLQGVTLIVLLIQVNIQTPVAKMWTERGIAEGIDQFVPKEAPLKSWKREFYGASLYSGRIIIPVATLPNQGDYCILTTKEFESIRASLPPPLQPNFVFRISRGFGGREDVLIVKIDSPGSGLGAV